MKSIFNFFAQRHTLANLFVIMVLLLGLNSLFNINRDLYPSVDFGLMSIHTTYPGASPEDVELNVTNKIEDALKNISGIKEMTSVSMENVSSIFITLDLDVKDQDRVKDNIREAVARIGDFPMEVADAPFIQEWNTTTSMQILEIGIAGDGTVPYEIMREYAKQFEKKLRTVSGVSRIEKFGFRTREVQVEVSPDKIKEFQIPLNEIIWAVQGRNIRTTAGNFESYTSEKNLVTLAQFKDPMEIKDVVVRSTFEGPLVKIKDLAVVREDFEEPRILTRMNGKTSISFKVFKSETADIIRTCDALKDLIQEEREYLPGSLSLDYSMDQSKYVSSRFRIVINNLLIGLALVVLTLNFFVNFRTSFWVAMGIPISLLGVIFLLPTFDVTLDVITMTAMILVIGIIVDDAIIISENIYTHRERGAKPLEAAVNGVTEVFRPVLTTVITTLIVFAPMFFMTGVFGKFITVIPLTITLALTISLIESLLILPSHLISGLKRAKPKKERSHEWFDYIKARYQKRVRWFLKFRYIVIPLFIFVLILSLWYAGSYLKFILFPTKMASDFYVLIEMPLGNSLEATSDKLEEIEKLIMDLPEGELESFASRVGYNEWIQAEMSNTASMFVNLTPYSERKRDIDQIVEHLREKTKDIEGIETIAFEIESGGPPVGRPVNIGVACENNALRKEIADSLFTFLNSIEGIKDIQRNDKAGKEQIQIQIDYNKLARLNLTVSDIARNMRIAYDGEILTSVRYGDEDVDFRIIFDKSSRRRISALLELPIPNQRGRLIPLREVATLKTGPGPADYRHRDGERTTTIAADVDQAIVTPIEVNERIFEHFNLSRDYPEARFVVSGEVVETEESMKSLMRTFMIAIIAIYFVLVLLFNSFTQPFLVMTAIPFGIVGVIIAFVIHGEPMSFMGMLGTIGLSGVVVNDSLVLTNHINELRQVKSGSGLIGIVAEGTANRLRPVILTTITTVVGLMPLAYGLGGSDPFMAPTALALGWGLVMATPLTLVLVPCLYVMGHDIAGLFRKKK